MFGPFVSVLGVDAAVGPALSALEADLANGLAAERDVVDSFSATEVTTFLGSKADAATHFTRTQAHAIFQSVSDSVAALALKRNVSDSHSLSEIATLLSGKANEAATKIAISAKQDKEGSLTAAQTAVLYLTIEAAANALAAKRDTADSYSIADLDSLLSTKASQSATTSQLSLKSEPLDKCSDCCCLPDHRGLNFWACAKARTRVIPEYD